MINEPGGGGGAGGEVDPEALAAMGMGGLGEEGMDVGEPGVGREFPAVPLSGINRQRNPWIVAWGRRAWTWGRAASAVSYSRPTSSKHFSQLNPCAQRPGTGGHGRGGTQAVTVSFLRIPRLTCLMPPLCLASLWPTAVVAASALLPVSAAP